MNGAHLLWNGCKVAILLLRYIYAETYIVVLHVQAPVV